MNAEEIRHNIASGGELVILQEEGKQYEFKSVEKYMLYMRPVPKITKTAGRNGVMTKNRSIGNCARCSNSIYQKGRTKGGQGKTRLDELLHRAV